MLKALGSRLTYANVMATVAAFLALGGGAFALSGIPDRSGVYHGCASNRTGALRVVKRASSCHKARGTGKHRDPGEFAVSWNQQGRLGTQGVRGLQGIQGLKGDKGDTGPPGISGYQIVTAVSAEDSSPAHEAEVMCPAGKKAIGSGGQIFTGPADSVALNAIIVLLDGSGVRADGREVVPTSSNWSVEVEAICANVAS